MCVCVHAYVNAELWSLVLSLSHADTQEEQLSQGEIAILQIMAMVKKMHPPAPCHMQHYYPSLPPLSCSTHKTKLVFLVW